MWSQVLLAAAALGAPPVRAERIHHSLQPPVRIEAAGEPINVEIGHAAPFVGDISGTGRLDLLVGQFGEGKLRVYPNVGSPKAPKFDKFEWFKANGAPGLVPAG